MLDWATHVVGLDGVERRLHVADKITALEGIVDDPRTICRQALASAAKRAGVVLPEVDEQATTGGETSSSWESLTDLGNAERFARQHASRVLHVRPWGYRVYDEAAGVWKDDPSESMRLAKLTARSWNRTAADTDDDTRRRAVQAHAKNSESARSLKATLELAASELALQASPGDFDAEPMLLNTPSGVVDLETGELREHSPRLRMTKTTGAPYLADARCPLWMAHLRRIFADNDDVMDFWQRWSGYCLTGLTTEQALVIPWGTGSNGKTATVETERVMRGDSAVGADMRSFTVTRSEGPRNDLARLAGARMATASESGASARLDESLVKQVTGGEPLTVRYLHQEHFEYVPQFKLVLSTNHKPEIAGTDHGIWRRVRLVPFTVTIPEDEQDRDLLTKLRGELSGILAWAVDGCLEWQRRGLEAPEAVRAATAGYRAEMDVVATFLTECTSPDPQASLPALYLYRAYQHWARRTGESDLTQRRFNAALKEHSVSFGERESGTGRLLCWGIRLNMITGEDQP